MVLRISKERFRQSAMLAELVAMSELRLSMWKRELKRGSNVGYQLRGEEDLLQRKQKQLGRDMIALELLPQARIRVQMIENRRLFIESKTFFGRLVEAVNTLEMIVDGVIEDRDQTPFPDEDIANHVWDSFVQAVKSNQGKAAVVSLAELLTTTKGEMLYNEMPPLPPPYEYEEMSYSPQQVH